MNLRKRMTFSGNLKEIECVRRAAVAASRSAVEQQCSHIEIAITRVREADDAADRRYGSTRIDVDSRNWSSVSAGTTRCVFPNQ
jgi:hypothetical protein